MVVSSKTTERHICKNHISSIHTRHWFQHAHKKREKKICKQDNTTLLSPLDFLTKFNIYMKFISQTWLTWCSISKLHNTFWVCTLPFIITSSTFCGPVTSNLSTSKPLSCNIKSRSLIYRRKTSYFQGKRFNNCLKAPNMFLRNASKIFLPPKSLLQHKHYR